MQKPLKLDCRNVVVPASVEKRIRRKAAKLDRVFQSVLGCQVAIETPEGHPRKGGRFNVRLVVSIPGRDIVISRQNAENLSVAVREAFDAAIRKLEEHSRIRRNNVKRHEEPPTGRIIRLFPEEGYGFISDGFGREIYFHRNSVRDASFDTLQVGAHVRFSEEQGNEGPQASSVSII